MKSNRNYLGAGVVVVSVALLAAFLAYHPLPDDFEEPWKYRFIKFNVEITNVFANALEYMGIVHRVNITRFFYHVSYGSFNARDSRDNISVSDDMIGSVVIRIFRPFVADLDAGGSSASTARPTIIFYHGGGYIVGSADIFEPVSYSMAKHTQYTVIYIEYRLIPEHKYPAAFNDSLETTIELIKQNAKYNIDVNNLVLMGDSAGGNLATVIGQQLIERNIARPRLQVLIYPILQFFDFTLPSYRAYFPASVLGSINHENFKMFISFFTGEHVDDHIFLNGHTTSAHKEKFSRFVNRQFLLNSKYYVDHHLDQLNDTSNRYERLSEILLSNKVSPLLVEDDYLEANTPENTLLITAEIDILRDDGFIYAERLRRVDKRVNHVHYDSLFHGIFGLNTGPLKFDKANEIVHKVAHLVKQTINVQQKV